MRRHHARVALVCAAGAIAVSTLSGATEAAASSTPAATPYPLAHSVTGLSSAGQMLWVNGHLFVSSGPDGSTVTVLSSTGQVVTQIRGEQGPDGMVADGDTLYVAQAATDQISVIDAASLTQSPTSYTVDACPTHLALSAGRLFYSYGCTSASSGGSGVSSIDPSDPGTPVVVSTDQSQTPALIASDGAGGTTLAVAAGNSLTIDTAAGDGTVSDSHSASVEEQPNDMAVTPDGSSVLLATGAPYEIVSYATATADQNLTYPGVPYPKAVAVDPSGTHVAAGFDSYDTTVSLYGADGSTTWNRYTSGTDPRYWVDGQSDDSVLPGTLTFSTDGTRVYGLVSRENTSGIFLFASSLDPSRASIAMTVPSVAPGKRLTARSVVKGAPRSSVSFTKTMTGSASSLGSVTASSSGVASKSFSSTYDGTVTAAFLGTATALPARVTTKYTVGSRTRSRLVGGFKRHHGITYFQSYKKVSVLFRTTPSESYRSNRVVIQQRRGRHWYKAGELTGHENQYGARIYFKRNPGSLPLRVKFMAATDSSSRGSSTTSKAFVVMSDRHKL